MPIPSRPLEEIGKLANDFLAGQIFTDRQIPPECGLDLGDVFMPLMFLDEKQHEELKADSPGMLFEYMNEAGPRSVNGCPVFMSVQYLSKEDFMKFRDIVKALQAAKDKVLASYAKSGDSTPS